MSVSVAEYLGQRTDVETPIIQPVEPGSEPPCPFMGTYCPKVKKKQAPVCSVRKSDGTLWIVCPDRLCSTKKNIPKTQQPLPLSNYQKEILHSVAKTLYGDSVPPSEIYYKREEKIEVIDGTDYRADFIMFRKHGVCFDPRRAVVEMQGGGETSQTKNLTNHVKAFERNPERTNQMLAQIVDGVGTIETNAWRRQQEQFIVKGNIAQQTGGQMVFCMGSLLYDYLWKRISDAKLNNLRDFNWTLALIAFVEDTSQEPQPGPIPIKIDEDRLLFTNYHTFVQALINQGGPSATLFRGEFFCLDGDRINLSQQALGENRCCLNFKRF
ncbi:NotI family restriction endonuclease [Methanoculleus sediminis]|uniref:NotI family restriction endonuclease n=1 Tax=Methanoculleus sediminis TaxID=1550566 RepID=UPI00064F8F90|nr:NotI family restriction endonuclease [Methanoculleus sediminis]